MDKGRLGHIGRVKTKMEQRGHSYLSTHGADNIAVACRNHVLLRWDIV